MDNIKSECYSLRLTENYLIFSLLYNRNKIYVTVENMKSKENVSLENLFFEQTCARKLEISLLLV